jgi:putative FmdB family regulatory protein
MDLFDYKCLDCEDVAEYLLFSSSEKPRCRKCGSENMEKLLSTFAVSVKTSSSKESAPSCPYGKQCRGGSCGL